MAQIITSSIVLDRIQIDGSRYVRVKFVAEDHDGLTREVFVGPRLVSSDFDVSAWMTGFYDAVLARLAEEENEYGVNVNAVENPLDYALYPKWSTTKNIAKAMIYWMMSEKSVRSVIYLEPLIIYIRANYTAVQISSLLDITIAQVLKMNTRINAVLTDVGTIKDLLEDYDGQEENL